MNKIFFVLAHGKAESIFMTKCINYYAILNNEYTTPYILAPDQKININQTQTTNLYKNLNSTINRNKNKFSSENRNYILIIIDINERDEVSEIVNQIKDNNIDLDKIKIIDQSLLKTFNFICFYSVDGIETAFTEILSLANILPKSSGAKHIHSNATKVIEELENNPKHLLKSNFNIISIKMKEIFSKHNIEK